MAYLYLELLKDSLNEYAYAAELAGLNYDLQNTIYGMYVSILISHRPHVAATPNPPVPPSTWAFVSASSSSSFLSPSLSNHLVGNARDVGFPFVLALFWI